MDSLTALCTLSTADLRKAAGNLTLADAKKLAAVAQAAAEARVRAKLEPALALLLDSHGLLLEAGPILVHKAGVTSLAELDGLSATDLESIGLTAAAAMRLKPPPEPRVLARPVEEAEALVSSGSKAAGKKRSATAVVAEENPPKRPLTRDGGIGAGSGGSGTSTSTGGVGSGAAVDKESDEDSSNEEEEEHAMPLLFRGDSGLRG